ncbi:putative ORFan [Tupanvirus deep ocean]|uniref:ORFan n=2 Tax=Tupanvirus TaxID=2094720 RepID=A0AC62A7X1_9VIRU|nr:putative ORFan [Tupanvirus deep ocean]QKU33881.1 putative ORFan [Tupanvirus deep ocean]
MNTDQTRQPIVITSDSRSLPGNNETSLSQVVCSNSSEINQKLEESVRYNYSCIPQEYKNENCIMFGGKVLFHSKDEDETIEEYRKLSEYLTVTLYIPVIKKENND